MKKNSILIFCLLSILLGCKSNTSNNCFTHVYCLDFDPVRSNPNAWSPLFLAPYKECLDSTFVYNGKHPLKLGPVQFLGMSTHFNYYNMQQFLLPELEAKEIEVRITSKMKNMTTARLLIDRISKKELIFATDTLDFVSKDTVWATVSCKLPANDMKMIGFQLVVMGDPVLKKDRLQNIWFDRIEIFLDGNSIDNYDVPVILPFPVKPDIQVEPLSFSENRYGRIPQLKKSKILALGETVHGSGSVNAVASGLIKHQISENNCRLVLLEVPFELMLSVNKLVKGNPTFSADSLIRDFCVLTDRPIWKELIEWITDFNNRHPHDPVTFMGMDLYPDEGLSVRCLKHYIDCLNRSAKSPFLKDLSAILSGNDQPSFNASRYMKDNPQIEQVIGQEESLMIKQVLEVSAGATPFPQMRMNLRDYTMKSNASFLIDLFASDGKRVLVYTHFQHVNYRSINGARVYPSFGSQMRNDYGSQYSCLGVLVGEGEILVNTADSLLVCRNLLSPKKNSLEYYFDSLNIPFFYCNTDCFPDVFSYIRAIGIQYSGHNGEYQLLLPKERMDGIIFIKDSEAAQVDYEIQGMSIQKADSMIRSRSKGL